MPSNTFGRTTVATLTEGQAIELLRDKFKDEGYSVIPQVPSGTGANKRRTADAIMVQMWPSRGLSFTGVEYKRTLGDWRRELKDVHKSEEIARFCRYWVILAPKGVIPVNEVPETWGLWEISEDLKLFRTRMPPAREEVDEPTMSLFCGILRAAERHDPGRAAITSARKAGYKQGFDDGLKSGKRAVDEKGALERKVREFEDASGLPIRYGWNLGKLGPELRKYLHDPEAFKTSLQRTMQTAETAQRELSKLLEELDEHRSAGQ